MAAASLKPERLAVGAVFQGSGAPCVGLAFHREGQFVASATADGTLRLIDAVNGVLKKTIHDTRNGVGALAFSHHAQSVLVAGGSDASKFGSDASKTVRYLSLYDNRYLRAFAGHDAPVTTVAPSPASDAFFTAGADGCAVLWDPSSKNAAVARLETRPARAWDKGGGPAAGAAAAAFSADAVVFAVGRATAGAKGGGVAKLYDVRNFAGGPFATFSVDAGAVAAAAPGGAPPGAWRGLAFSPDGESLLVKADGAVLLLDAFEGTVLAALPAGGGGAACFTPDGAHVIAGGNDGALRVWAVAHPKRRPTVLKAHAGAVAAVAASPKYDVVASACANACLWIA